MSELILCPHCGATMPPSSAIAQGDTIAPDGPDFPEDDVPPVTLLASGSNDDLFRARPALENGGVAVSPDPILGQFVPDRSGPRTPSTADSFPKIDLDRRPTGPARPEFPTEDEPDEDEDEDEPAAGTPWTTVLLASYASATTIALGWFLLTQRGREPRPEEPPPAVDSRPEPGRQASLSRVIEPPKPLPEDRIATLGQPLKVGALEVRPVDVRRQDVVLQRVDFSGRTAKQQAGGKDAFVVRLRLRNLSRDLAFAPIDQAFVRERGGVVDSFVETASGAKIYPYPLALESELSIVGQDFAQLRPGESRVVAIATAPDAPGDDQGPFLWRIRLRTGLDQVESIGVRWSTTPGPAPAKK